MMQITAVEHTYSCCTGMPNSFWNFVHNFVESFEKRHDSVSDDGGLKAKGGVGGAGEMLGYSLAMMFTRSRSRHPPINIP